MLKYELVWSTARDMDLPAVDGAMVGGAEADLVTGVVGATLGSRLNVSTSSAMVFRQPGT